VPAGNYKIRKAIEILPRKRPGGGWYQDIRIFGDGMYQSIISQQVDTENCIDWTGLAYGEGCRSGQLDSMYLAGGNITLNLKWHSSFLMTSCRISGAQTYGVYTEGWSSRFLHSIFRWCGQAGFYGGAHFNNAIIRDCYVSRTKIGIELRGGHGSRIEGCGFEHCPKAAIFVAGMRGLTINNCYFECNGYTDSEHFPIEGPGNTIQLDRGCLQVNIHDCILRANLDDQGAAISVADCVGGHIYDNLFYTSKPGVHKNGIMLRAQSETNPDAETSISKLVVEHNIARNVAKPLVEEQPGLVEQAIANGSSFDWEVLETD